jgi:hypothetical protein
MAKVQVTRPDAMGISQEFLNAKSQSVVMDILTTCSIQRMPARRNASPATTLASVHLVARETVSASLIAGVTNKDNPIDQLLYKYNINHNETLHEITNDSHPLPGSFLGSCTATP